ncbi:MAG TPA: hypothetical protein VK961_25275 [Chthoniobacter sp.]|nr:hypothetical protein [Chthoniobacter sp.]
MIRYPVKKVDLEALITAEKPTWLGRAAAKTAEFKRKGFYTEDSSIWSEVKVVYMRLQGMGKCAYCEREMEAEQLGKGEQDVEHFRPKGSVKAWKASQKLSDAGVIFAAAPAAGKGYYLLPYHPFNYCAACKPCNSVLKSDYFPISGAYDLDADDPENVAMLAAEGAYLLYPIGSLDDDPETIIEFYGLSPRPVAATGMKRHRALVTIEFFRLDDPEERKNLYRDRAILILALFPLLEKTRQGTPAAKTAAKATVKGFLKPELRHLNCARNFQGLFERDAIAAKEIYDGALKLVTSIS